MKADAASLDRNPGCAERLRREPRSAVAMTCQLRVGSGPWRPASLVDLSPSGFRVAWLPQCGAGRKLWVRIPGFEAMPATIRWRDHRGVGCQFARPVHRAVVDHLSRIAPPRA